MADQPTNAELLTLTGKIVGAYLANNAVGPEALPSLIKSVFESLTKVDAPDGEPIAKLRPAVPIKNSVFPGYIVCLEDGKKLTMLKRHLATTYRLTPDQYRKRWSLPRDYPMISPNYAARRAALAKQFGLGRRAAKPEAEPRAVVEPARKARKKAAE